MIQLSVLTIRGTTSEYPWRCECSGLATFYGVVDTRSVIVECETCHATWVTDSNIVIVTEALAQHQSVSVPRASRMLSELIDQILESRKALEGSAEYSRGYSAGHEECMKMRIKLSHVRAVLSDCERNIAQAEAQAEYDLRQMTARADLAERRLEVAKKALVRISGNIPGVTRTAAVEALAEIEALVK